MKKLIITIALGALMAGAVPAMAEARVEYKRCSESIGSVIGLRYAKRLVTEAGTWFGGTCSMARAVLRKWYNLPRCGEPLDYAPSGHACNFRLSGRNWNCGGPYIKSRKARVNCYQGMPRTDQVDKIVRFYW